MMRKKFVSYNKLALQLQCENTYAFDCIIFRLSCLTAKALRRMTMRGFLVGATEPENHTLKRVQLRLLGL